ncbi:endonuclease exonuclease phosphatase family protein [Colletotrichum musicola]|uniref:Endonuclease exonuclease phosphatase family protein n=1 Tax=Colletotrichum musicola TaxID=2175873 RepID=A0A8H6KJ46_9PEZI|nr:endonuclease exonuclease phosphatase family protein [Colletotrichum musicola]
MESSAKELKEPANQPVTGPGRELSIVTWNVNARADHQDRRLTAIFSRLLEWPPVPDVIFLQEVNMKTFFSAILGDDRIRADWLSSEGDASRWQGREFMTITLLSKECFKFPNPTPGFDPATCILGRVSRIKFSSRCGRDALCAEVLVPSQRSLNYHHVQLLNVHLDSQPPLGDGRAIWNRRHHQLFVAAGVLHNKHHGLVAGDFNGMSPEEEKSIEDMRLSDAWKYLHGDDDPGYTWFIEGNTAFLPKRRDRVATLGLKVLDMQIIHPGNIDDKTAAEKKADNYNPDDNKRVPWSDHSGLRCTFMLTE